MTVLGPLRPKGPHRMVNLPLANILAALYPEEEGGAGFIRRTGMNRRLESHLRPILRTDAK
jgi:hypothetical protein